MTILNKSVLNIIHVYIILMYKKLKLKIIYFPDVFWRFFHIFLGGGDDYDFRTSDTG